MKFSGETLYVIGNGFDLHHNIESRYSQFGEFIRENDSQTFSYVDQYLNDGSKTFWHEFEENLAHLDTHSLLESASEYLVGYGSEDWSDAYHHSYQNEIGEVVEALSSKLHGLFRKWIEQLYIPSRDEIPEKLLNIDFNAKFLNFNYTPTINYIYGVADENILYIHGKSAEKEKLHLGHGWAPRIQEEPNFDREPDEEDPRIQEGDQIIKHYFSKTFKATDLIISANREFFDSLATVKNIFVFGHSLADVDTPYFIEILKNIDKYSVRWKVSYFEDVDSVRANFEQLGINSELVEYITLTDCR